MVPVITRVNTFEMRQSQQQLQYHLLALMMETALCGIPLFIVEYLD